MTIRQIQLRNARMIIKNGKRAEYHDLFIDDKKVLNERLYIDCFNYVLLSGRDNDFYTEPECCPEYEGEFIEEIRIKENKRNNE